MVARTRAHTHTLGLVFFTGALLLWGQSSCGLDESGSIDLQGKQCLAETIAPCYQGPPNTKNVGQCVSGIAVCRIDGTWGECVGQVLPAEEDCFTVADEDCDGVGRGDEQCHCTPGETLACDTGAVGICAQGTRTCADDGAAFDACLANENPSAENCARPEDENCDGQSPACTGDLFISKSDGGPLADVAFAIASNGVAQALGGVVDGDVNFKTANAGSAMIERRDATLTSTWKKVFPAVGGRSVVRGVAVTPKGAVMAAGHFFGTMDIGGNVLVSQGEDPFLFATDPLGKILWAKRWGDASPQMANALALDISGFLAIGGEVWGSIDLGGGAKTAQAGDAFVAMLDTKGNQIWSMLWGDASIQRVYSVAFTPSGDIVVAGEFDGTLNMTNPPLVSAGADAFVACIAKSGGTPKWAIKLGDDAFAQHGYAVAVSKKGDIAVTGGFGGTITIGQTKLTAASAEDIFVAVLDSQGTLQWAKRFGENGADQVGSALAFDEPGNLLLAGHFDGNADFGNGPLIAEGQADAFLAKFDGENGNVVWAKRAGDAQTQRAFALTTTPGARITLAGGFTGVLDWGPPAMPNTSKGGFDVFVANVAP